jgi:putative ABC transport system substrate-binding protein
MRRRDFVKGIARTAAAWPLAALAQPTGKLPTIGFLGTASASTWTSWTAAFASRLRELGWIEGHTVAIEYRWAEGRSIRFAEIAAEFVRLKVDVIVTSGSAVLQVEKATSAIPIVFAIASDPVGTGMVASFARPGGNATAASGSNCCARRCQVRTVWLCWRTWQIRQVYPK